MKIQQISQSNIEQLPRPLRERVGVRGLFDNSNHNELYSKVNERNTNLNHSPLAIANAAKISFGSVELNSPNDLFAEEILKPNPNVKKLLNYINDEDFRPNKPLKCIHSHNYGRYMQDTWENVMAPPLFVVFSRIKCWGDSQKIMKQLVPVFRTIAAHPDTDPCIPAICDNGTEYRILSEIVPVYKRDDKRIDPKEWEQQIFNIVLENCSNYPISKAVELYNEIASYNPYAISIYEDKLLDHLEKLGLPPHDLFAMKIRRQQQKNTEKLIYYINKEGFDPNATIAYRPCCFPPNAPLGEFTLLHFICLQEEPEPDFSKVVAALVKHPAIDINKLSTQEQDGLDLYNILGMRNHTAKYIFDYYKVILNNNPNVDLNIIKKIPEHFKYSTNPLKSELISYYEKNQISPAILFADEFERKNKVPNPEKIAKAIKMPDFEPNATVGRSSFTPMFCLLRHDNKTVFLSDEVADLARHKTFNPNLPLNDTAKSTYLLEYIITQNLNAAAINLRKILENNPHVKVVDAPTEYGEVNMIELAEQKGKKDLAKLLRDYEEHGGRQKAAEKYVNAGGLFLPRLYKQNDYSELSIDELFEFLKAPQFNVLTKDIQGNLLIHTAVTMKNPRSKELISLSNEKIKNIDVKNAKGQTPAMLALESIGTCENKDERRICYGIFKFILELNPDLTINDSNGLNLEDYAGELNDSLIKQMLEQYKASKKD